MRVLVSVSCSNSGNLTGNTVWLRLHPYLRVMADIVLICSQQGSNRSMT
jgi:hypothetical protein